MVNKSGLFQKVRKQVKKISQFGTVPVNKLNNHSDDQASVKYSTTGQVLEGRASQRDTYDLDYQDIHQLFRHQFPAVTRQVFGKRYNTLNKASRFVLPNGMDQAADEILEFLGEFAISLASTEKVLAETGSKSIQELQKDPARSERAGNAMKEVNKILAAIQGGLSGMAGLVGAAADLPISVILSLKTIYEIGHAYGFELDNEEDQQAVYYALSKSDLSLIAEKQALFLGLRSIQGIFKTGDYHELQNFLNSNYSFEHFQNLLTDADGQYKWNGLNVLSKVKILRYATPLLGGAIGAFYNVKLIDEVASHAHDVFSSARQYLTNNPSDGISALEAYHHAKKSDVNSIETAKILDQSLAIIDANQDTLAQTRKLEQSSVEVGGEKVKVTKTAQADSIPLSEMNTQQREQSAEKKSVTPKKTATPRRRSASPKKPLATESTTSKASTAKSTTTAPKQTRVTKATTTKVITKTKKPEDNQS